MTKVLATGATGNVGSQVVQQLRAQGVSVRAFVRDAGKAAGMFGDETERSVELALGDFSDAASVQRAVEGVEAVFLACSNDPRQVEFETGVIEAARKAGVRRIVKLSALGAEVGSSVAFWDWHGRIEEHLWVSGLPAIVLRPTFNMTNLLGSAEMIRQAGSLFAPAGGARVAMIDPKDVAAVAAAALSEDRHDGKTYTLTGPEAITFERVAEELSAVASRRIQFVAVPDEAAREGMVEQGMPEFVAGQIVAVFGTLRRGDQDRTTSAVCALTGREPRGFAEFARDHAITFRAPGKEPGERDTAQTAMSAESKNSEDPRRSNYSNGRKHARISRANSQRSYVPETPAPSPTSRATPASRASRTNRNYNRGEVAASG
jgi:uncharacterized protein YbjT (DUF2867 family)